MQARARHQCGESLHEFQRRHHDEGRAILVGALQLQLVAALVFMLHCLAGSAALEAFIGNGRAGDVAAGSSSSRYATQVLKLLALISVTARPLRGAAARSGRRCRPAPAVWLGP